MLLQSETLTHDQMKKMVNTHKCSCGANLSVAWGGAFGHNCFILRCVSDKDHDQFIKPFEVNGYNLPGYNMPATINKKIQELKRRYGEQMTNELVKHAGGNPLAILNESRALDIINTLWPGAPDVEKKKAALVCSQYGLNPLMKHLYLIPFNSKNGDKWEKSYSMVLGIKASRIIARRKGEYGYLDDTPRIMTEAEQIKIFGEVDTANVCAITRLADRKGNTSIGTGRWPKDTAVKGADKGNTKLNMAMIRSERQALDRLFPDSLPESDVVDERYQDLPEVSAEVMQPEPKQIEQPEEATEVKEPVPETKAEEKAVPIIGNWNDLEAACKSDYNMKPEEIYVLFGGKSHRDLSIGPAEVWERVKQVRAKK